MLKFKNIGIFIKRNSKIIFRMIGYIHVHFMRVLNFLVHVTLTLMNVYVIFSDMGKSPFSQVW